MPKWGFSLTVLGPTYEKTRSDGPHSKSKIIIFEEITKIDHKLPKTFYFSKYHMFCEVYESFSIVCDVFFVWKRAILAKTAVRLIVNS